MVTLRAICQACRKEYHYQPVFGASMILAKVPKLCGACERPKKVEEERV